MNILKIIEFHALKMQIPRPPPQNCSHSCSVCVCVGRGGGAQQEAEQGSEFSEKGRQTVPGCVELSTSPSKWYLDCCVQQLEVVLHGFDKNVAFRGKKRRVWRSVLLNV